MNFRTFIEGAQKYYHGTCSKFPDGFILKPQKAGYVQVEALMEKYRPLDKLSRFNSVFLVGNPDEIDSAGGYEDHIYEVQPIGKVEVSDLSWYSDLQIDSTDDEKRTWALNYWNGVPYKNKENSLIEYRAPQAKIIREI